MPLFSANPSKNTDQWYVWDTYQTLPPKPVFFGTMEEAGLVADTLNERAARTVSNSAGGAGS